MSKKKMDFCSVCGKDTLYMIKRKIKTSPQHQDLNLNYCMTCKTGYQKQLTGRK